VRTFKIRVWRVGFLSGILFLLLLAASGMATPGDKPVDFQDLMKFNKVSSPNISIDGKWIAYQLKPNREDGKVIIRSVDTDKEYTVDRGSTPRISRDSKWVACTVLPPVKTRLKLEGEKGGTTGGGGRSFGSRRFGGRRSMGGESGDDTKDELKNGMTLIHTLDGKVTEFKKIQSFTFSKDSRWLAYKPYKEKSKEKPKTGPDAKKEKGETEEASPEKGETSETKEVAPEEESKKEKVKEKKGKAGKGEGKMKPSVEGKERREGGRRGRRPRGAVKGAEGKKVEEQTEKTAEKTKEKPAESSRDKKKKENIGSTVILRRLETGVEKKILNVSSFTFDDPSKWFVFTLAEPGGEENGVYKIDLGKDGCESEPLKKDAKGRYSSLSWVEDKSVLAFLAAVDDEDQAPGPAEVWCWEGGEKAPKKLVAAEHAPDGWMIPSSRNYLRFSKDGERIFFSFKPEDPEKKKKDKEKEAKKKEQAKENDSEKEGEKKGEKIEKEEEEIDLFDLEKILEKSKVDVWHWNDPYISTHQKKQWEREKNRSYVAVVHLKSGKVVPLADKSLPEVNRNDNPLTALGLSNLDYRKEVTWDTTYNDIYTINLDTGEKVKVIDHLSSRPSLSPCGGFVAFYRDKHWWLMDTQKDGFINLTEKLNVPFDNEEHDYPSPPPSYRLAQWTEDDSAVFINDRYDIWRFSTADGSSLCITGGEGRKEKRQFRIIDTDRKRDSIRPDEKLLLSSFSDVTKGYGFYSAGADSDKVTRLMESNNYFRFLSKAEEADRVIYTKESYSEFPDVWTADLSFNGAKKMTDANPHIKDYAWGEAELVKWASADGIPLDGVLIKPGNYKPGKRYPVLVYFYRLMSSRLYRFNDQVVSSRPPLSMYSSQGYAIFLPDIRFEVGRPGFSSTKALVPGVQKLVDMGIADPDAIGLQGHSWGGYQAAFVITQTRIFKAAVAGAPVTNMTSAYSGIRLSTGVARQFQYEKTQSRIGGTLYEMPEKYIENSPIFHVQHIETPLLIEFGDNDGAVPWQQGIELYLAMRRLGKNCIMLQYRDEAHGLKKYANKLDYAMKMKAFFDHHLKGETAPKWMTDGKLYNGK